MANSINWQVVQKSAEEKLKDLQDRGEKRAEGDFKEICQKLNSGEFDMCPENKMRVEVTKQGRLPTDELLRGFYTNKLSALLSEEGLLMSERKNLVDAFNFSIGVCVYLMEREEDG